MPWFIYNYPLTASLPTSYNLSLGEPTCTGTRLCAIYASTQPDTDPAVPIISQSVLQAINSAQSGIITPGVTKLRPLIG